MSDLTGQVEPTWEDNEKRAEYVAGLRQLADALEQSPELGLPYSGTGTSLLVIPRPGNGQRAELRAWARVLPGHKDKQVRGEDFDLIGTFAGLKIQVICDRDEVCERVVVGTETVTQTVKDPEALAQVPEVEVTEEREVVEWRCGSLLTAESEAAAGRSGGAS